MKIFGPPPPALGADQELFDVSIKTPCLASSFPAAFTWISPGQKVIIATTAVPYQTLKLQVVEFTIPYYFFLMISVTLVVSSISFYLNLRDLLYPKL